MVRDYSLQFPPQIYMLRHSRFVEDSLPYLGVLIFNQKSEVVYVYIRNWISPLPPFFMTLGHGAGHCLKLMLGQCYNNKGLYNLNWQDLGCYSIQLLAFCFLYVFLFCIGFFRIVTKSTLWVTQTICNYLQLVRNCEA